MKGGDHQRVLRAVPAENVAAVSAVVAPSEEREHAGAELTARHLRIVAPPPFTRDVSQQFRATLAIATVVVLVGITAIVVIIIAAGGGVLDTAVVSAADAAEAAAEK